MSSFNFQNNTNSSFGSPNSLITNAANAFFSGPSQVINTNNNTMNQYSPNNQPNFNNQASNQNFGYGVGTGTGIGANNISNNNQTNSYQSNTTAVKTYSPMPPILKKGFTDFKPVRSKNSKLDEKHLVKCITLLNQNIGSHRNELRFKFVNMIPVKMPSFNNQQNSSNNQLMPSTNTQPVPTSSFGFGNFPKSTNQSFTLGATPTLGTSPTLNTASNFFNQNKDVAGNGSFNFGNSNKTNVNANLNLNSGNNSFLGGNTNGMNFQINSNQPNNNSNSQFNFGNRGFNTGSNNAFNNNNSNYNSFSNGFNSNNNNGFNIGSNIAQPNNTQNQNNFNTNQNFNFSSPNFPQNHNTLPSMNNQQAPLPSTGLFAPPDHNTISVFPYSTNLLALTLINSLLNQNPTSQQNQIQSSTNPDPAVLLLDQLFGNVLYEAVVVNSLVNSDYFKSLTEEKKVLLENAIRDKVRGKKPQKQNKLFQLSGQSQNFYNKKIEKQERSSFEGFMSQKQRPIYYRAPFLYQESSYEFNEPPIIKKSKYSRGSNFFDDQFEIKKIRSSENRPRRFYANAPQSSKDQNVFGKTVLDQFQQNYKVFQKIVQRQITVKAHELPINDDQFVMLPSIENFKEMTLEQLKRVDNVMISNQFGRVQFKEPISMYQKNLSSCIKIQQDLIQIIDREWMNKRCDLTYINFSGYLQADVQERKRLRKKILKWASRNFMHNCHIQETTGDVTVQISS